MLKLSVAPNFVPLSRYRNQVRASASSSGFISFRGKAWSRSYDRELQPQRCKILQRNK
jgi:hypothetical protein